MTTSVMGLSPAAGWQPVMTGDEGVAVAQRSALGTTARTAVWPPDEIGRACTAVDQVLDELDRQASRFREDSEVSLVHRAGGGMFMVSDGLAEVLAVALAAARWTGGLTDPTVGGALVSLGYDRDFASIEACSTRPLAPPGPVPGWELVRLDGRILRLPHGIRLDLGATAKGVGSDRAARAALAVGEAAGGVLVSLGGDIAVSGTSPQGGWPVAVEGSRDDVPGPAGLPEGQVVRLTFGGVATSSTTYRQWRRAGQVLHHIVDPRTGLPSEGPWRTVTVAAATCADANAAATAAIIAGEEAPAWLASVGVPARLAAGDGSVLCVGGWPEGDGTVLPVPRHSHVYLSRPGRPG
ncbi:MAG TPA: FAD:protein FMN transferase [Streptosporangiaceae bacterium]|nr:FAD:protein FMN transferase [Streptosporangiaceae bacterium]